MGGGSLLVEDSDSESGLEAGLEKTAVADFEASAARAEGAQKEGDGWKGSSEVSEQVVAAGWNSWRMETARRGGEGACGTGEWEAEGSG